jgi:hypothetical protein
MTKEEIILKLVCSLNTGDSYFVDQRVNVAIEQYEKLVKKGIIKESRQASEDRELSRLETDALIASRFRPPAQI